MTEVISPDSRKGFPGCRRIAVPDDRTLRLLVSPSRGGWCVMGVTSSHKAGLLYYLLHVVRLKEALCDDAEIPRLVFQVASELVNVTSREGLFPSPPCWSVCEELSFVL